MGKGEDNLANEEWIVHINEGFVVTVKAPSPDLAFVQAWAAYIQERKQLSTLLFDVQILNKKEYDTLQLGKPKETTAQ